MKELNEGRLFRKEEGNEEGKELGKKQDELLEYSNHNLCLRRIAMSHLINESAPSRFC